MLLVKSVKCIAFIFTLKFIVDKYDMILDNLRNHIIIIYQNSSFLCRILVPIKNINALLIKIFILIIIIILKYNYLIFSSQRESVYLIYKETFKDYHFKFLRT